MQVSQWPCGSMVERLTTNCRSIRRLQVRSLSRSIFYHFLWLSVFVYAVLGLLSNQDFTHEERVDSDSFLEVGVFPTLDQAIAEDVGQSAQVSVNSSRTFTPAYWTRNLCEYRVLDCCDRPLSALYRWGRRRSPKPCHVELGMSKWYICERF